MDKTKRFNVLSYLRVLACVLIIRGHYNSGFDLPTIFAKVILTGAGPVVIFFVISGFLAFCALDKNFNVKLYYLRRAVRIIPTYYCVLLVCIVINSFIRLGTEELGILSWIRYATFTNMLIPSSSFYNYNNLFGFWTMGCFPIFYLLAPFIYKQMKNNSRVLMVLVTSIFLSVANRVFINAIFGRFGFDNLVSFSNLTPLTLLYLFIFGMISAYAYKRSEEKKISFVYGVLFMVCLMTNKSGYILWGIACALITLVPDIGGKERKHTFIKGLWDRIIQFLDVNSFNIYLCHTLVARVWTELTNGYGFLDASICVIITLIMAEALRRIVDIMVQHFML